MSALAIAPTFLSDFTRLTPDVQLNTLAVMRAYQAGERPALEPVADAADPRVRIVGIDPDWSGVVVPAPADDEPDDGTGDDPAEHPRTRYRLLTVLPREEALRFARRLVPASPEIVPLGGGAPADPRPSGPPELAGALRAPFRQWQVTLHPDQHRITEAHYNGAVQITGGPGTGKTVIALHRAAHLAERDAAAHPEDHRESVLLTTYNRALAQSLSDRLDQLLPDPGVRARVRVATIDSLARSVVQAHGVPPRLIGKDDLARRWRALALADGLPFSGRFLVDEWEQVILAKGMELLPEYIRCERSGRVQHLAPEHRRQVWETIRRYVGAMRVEGLWSYPQLAAEAARVLGRGAPLFRHAVVDEAQDLHPAQWRMLRAAVPEGPDDLFIVGDPHQRVSDNRVSLASLGINVRGRGHRLRVGYRVTQEILDWSMPILGRRAALGMDDDADTLAGYRSLLRGPAPVVRGCADRAEELAALGDWVRVWLEAGVDPTEIAVAGRNHWVVRGIDKELTARGIPTAPLEESGGSGAVRVGTLHRLKGQEFRCVALVGVADHLLPPKAAIEAADGDQVALEHAFQQERTLLFTACTRARDALYVSHVGRPSRLIAEGR
ncbi:UvrD-helicase domain-containing protein [Nocardiopsis changdeensis]|uniref:DNA 3'-5' helicase n=1 Tax=Nocardiopsis changdeensis TaxID=2831969 RepID=A0ABX8BLH2_9ACTN|nr:MULTISPECIES: UvrD-helicase domain-containing protein [Nocardiopsis]QUX21643.1 AAA family ATPase [Nocardiopsis changdeensis]QYX37577.1 AAA family ATPase [Nocardiopsis sp. MT53]